MNNTEILISLFLIKHFVADFPLQNKFQWSNKGTYGHLGGILHAYFHGVFTTLCLFWFIGSGSAILLGIVDAIIHYHIDWAKMNINTKMCWYPDTNEEFWWLLGIDQLLHGLTYVWLIHLALQYV